MNHTRSNCIHIVVAAAFAAVAALPRLTSAQIFVTGSTLEERAALPGESYSNSIRIANASAQTQSVRLYQTDYSFHSDGTSEFPDGGTTSRSNARWVSALARSVSVPARSEISVAYTVRVPSDSALSGSYWSVVMVEAAPVAPPPKQGAKPQVGLGAVVRYAVQIATHIGSTGARTITLAAPEATADKSGTHTLTLDLRNTGTRATRPLIWVEAYDASGAQKARVHQQRGMIYPGSSVKQAFVLGRLPAGPYKLLVFADTGDPVVVAKQFDVRF